MNYPAWKFWLDALQFIATAVIGGYVWWTNREKVTSARFAKLEEEVIKRATTATIDAQVQRLIEVEAKLRNVPGCCSGHPEMSQRLNGHNDRLSQHKELIDRLAGNVQSLPKTTDLERVHHRVDQVFRLADSIKGQLMTLSGNISILLEHHIKEK